MLSAIELKTVEKKLDRGTGKFGGLLGKKFCKTTSIFFLKKVIQ